MICSIKKLITIGSGILFSVFFSVLSYSYSYAISDLSVTYTANQSVSDSLFPDCDSTCYSNYQYLKVIVPTPNHDYMTRFSLGYYTSSNNYYHEAPFPYWGVSIYDISNLYGFKYVGSFNTWPYDITFILTNSIGDCPACETCPVCPTIPENPYDNKLDNITKAIYVCAGTVLVIYFFYTIYRLIIKNSGVK